MPSSREPEALGVVVVALAGQEGHRLGGLGRRSSASISITMSPQLVASFRKVAESPAAVSRRAPTTSAVLVVGSGAVVQFAPTRWTTASPTPSRSRSAEAAGRGGGCGRSRRRGSEEDRHDGDGDHGEPGDDGHDLVAPTALPTRAAAPLLLALVLRARQLTLTLVAARHAPTPVFAVPSPAYGGSPWPRAKSREEYRRDRQWGDGYARRSGRLALTAPRPPARRRPPVLIAGFPAGPWGTNCYVVATGRRRASAWSSTRARTPPPGVAEVVREHRLKPVAVLLTHGHIDHMWSRRARCAGAYDATAWIHPRRPRTCSTDPMAGMSRRDRRDAARRPATSSPSPTTSRELADGRSARAGRPRVRGRPHARAHRGLGDVPDAVRRATDVSEVMFSGDLLFAGSIGRTDLPGGDHPTMLRSLRDEGAAAAPTTIVVLPGHGEQTTHRPRARHQPVPARPARATPTRPTPPTRGL